MFLRDIERSRIAEAIIGASVQLKPWPGDDYAGDCDLFQSPRQGDGPPTGMPRCAGQCRHGGNGCYFAVVAWEGHNSGHYYVAAFCTDQPRDKLDHWVRHVNGELMQF